MAEVDPGPGPATGIGGAPSPGRVTGIGGVFRRARGPDSQRAFYAARVGD